LADAEAPAARPQPPAFTHLYHRVPGLVLGFHGCDAAVAESIFSGKEKHLKASKNQYDWLGSGVYFWENDPQRAWEFAVKGMDKAPGTKGYVAQPCVVGAVLDLGFCFNLTDRRCLDELSTAYQLLVAMQALAGEPMPVNKGHNHGARFLDRSVIETAHDLREQVHARDPNNASPPYESVRCPFPEGDPTYSGGMIGRENHIQIAVRSLDCIKGYFRPFVA
jgi:hypothetical protein